MQSFLLLEDFKKNTKKPYILIGLAVGGVLISFVIGNRYKTAYNYYLY